MMRLTRALSLVLGCLTTAAGVASAQEVRPDSFSVPEIRTSGTAERRVPPDRASVTLRLSAVGATPSVAGSAVAALADSLRTALAALGVPRDSIINARRYYYWRGRVEVTIGRKLVPIPDSILRREWGDRPIPPSASRVRDVPDTLYRVHDAMDVPVRDLRLVGRVIDLALSYRVTDISPIQYEADNTVAAEEAALLEATERARAKAAIIARAAGGTLGKTLLLSTLQDYGYRDFLSDVVVTGSTQAGTPTEVIVPQIVVRATVHGRWQLIERSP